MNRRALRLLPPLALLVCGLALAADPAKILRVASPDIETLDPQQYSDSPSFDVLVAIFEPLYEWDYLHSPPRLSPVTAAGPLEITDGGKTWTMRVKRGIFFTDDAAFKGKPRELVAADYVYSYKRWLDPNLRRGGAPVITDLIVGARPVVDAARADSKFDYDRPIEGLRALDRYTVQIRLSELNYPNIEDMIGFVGAAAREVVEAGPFRVEAIQVTHSIIDALGLAIRTPAGTVIHTGDFKIDHTPVDGRTTDLATFARYGEEGVLALLSDSTNALVPGHCPSERSVGSALGDLFAQTRGRIVITTFASHIHRVQQVLDLAMRHRRKVFLVGRSLVDNIETAVNLALATRYAEISSYPLRPPAIPAPRATGEGQP